VSRHLGGLKWKESGKQKQSKAQQSSTKSNSERAAAPNTKTMNSNRATLTSA